MSCCCIIIIIIDDDDDDNDDEKWNVFYLIVSSSCFIFGTIIQVNNMKDCIEYETAVMDYWIKPLNIINLYVPFWRMMPILTRVQYVHNKWLPLITFILEPVHVFICNF